MTREEFIEKLCLVFGEDACGIYDRGRREGWLEQEDDLFRKDNITRKNVARILHMYLLKVKGIKDLPDISKAEVLRDLYDCRVCANHVAQMYLRGIMDARNIARDGEFLWFDLDKEEDDLNIERYLQNIRMRVVSTSYPD